MKVNIETRFFTRFTKARLPLGVVLGDSISAKDGTGSCVLMFSGGRDSSIAAVRLGRAGYSPTLVTITSDHLLGIEKVKQRLIELAPHLPSSTRWLQIAQPIDLATDTSFYERTCLPCHHAYVVVAAATARSVGAQKLAFGYAGYQSDWPEQTPLAMSRLRTLLADYRIELDLPVLDVASRSDAEAILVAMGLSPMSLEQKCSRQVTNIALDEEKLNSQIALWETAIRRSMNELDRIPSSIIEDTTLGSAAHPVQRIQCSASSAVRVVRRIQCGACSAAHPVRRMQCSASSAVHPVQRV